MLHKVPKLIFLVFLNLVVASPVLFSRRDEVGSGGDSFWGGLDLQDIIGAGAAAGLEALLKMWDFSTTAPPVGGSTIPPLSGSPPTTKQPEDEGILESPDPDPVEKFPLIESTKMKACPVVAGHSQGGDQFDRLAVEESRWQVEQEPETGYVVSNFLHPNYPLPPTRKKSSAIIYCL